MTWLLLVAGLVLLLGGGEALVKGSVSVASRLGVSPLLIGLTLVGFGTSMPELVASVQAALRGAPGIAIGNIVGSNIANILLILGISALILPVATDKNAFKRDGSLLIAASVIFTVLVLFGRLDTWVGALLVALLIAYTLFSVWSEQTSGDTNNSVYAAEAADVGPLPGPLAFSLALTIGGIAGVVFGAALLVDAAIEIAEAAGLSEAVIGLTLVAVGTSLPELATSVMAAIRRHGDVAFGNIVGSCIFNVLGIAGVTALVKPIDVPPEIAQFDIWVMLGSVALLVAFAVTGWRVVRVEGLIFIAAYAAYLGIHFMPGGIIPGMG